jgi:hypothetical protein
MSIGILAGLEMLAFQTQTEIEYLIVVCLVLFVTFPEMLLIVFMGTIITKRFTAHKILLVPIIPSPYGPRLNTLNRLKGGSDCPFIDFKQPGPAVPLWWFLQGA